MEDEDDWNLYNPQVPAGQVDRSTKTQETDNIVSFGHIGENKSKTHEGGWTEITRVVGDIRYNQPPSPILGWSTLTDHHFAMVWADSPLKPPFTSLESLAEKFRNQKSSPSNALLIELDKKFDAYLAVLEKLEKAGWTQGLVSPCSVLFKETAAETVAVFPDLGFRWIGDFGAPEWLRNHPGKELFGRQSPSDRQEAWKPSLTENWKLGEIRIAAKMMAYCVGQTENSLKQIGKDHTMGDTQSPGFLGVLLNAIDGKYPTTSEFRTEVSRNPPSKSHEIRSKRSSTISKQGIIKRPVLLWALGLTIIVSVLGFWLFLQNIKTADNDGKDKVEIIDPKNGSNLGALANDVTKALQKKPKNKEELQELKIKRDELNKAFIKELKKISDKYGDDQDRSFAIKSLKTIIEHMQSIVKDLNSTNENIVPEEESQCLAFAEAFLVQLSQ